MSPFAMFTEVETNKPISVNLLQIVCARPSDGGTEIMLTNDHTIRVVEGHGHVLSYMYMFDGQEDRA